MPSQFDKDMGREGDQGSPSTPLGCWAILDSERQVAVSCSSPGVWEQPAGSGLGGAFTTSPISRPSPDLDMPATNSLTGKNDEDLWLIFDVVRGHGSSQAVTARLLKLPRKISLPRKDR